MEREIVGKLSEKGARFLSELSIKNELMRLKFKAKMSNEPFDFKAVQKELSQKEYDERYKDMVGKEIKIKVCK